MQNKIAQTRRIYIQKKLGENLMTFAVPYSFFTEMEANVDHFFLERRTWQTILRMKDSVKSAD